MRKITVNWKYNHKVDSRIRTIVALAVAVLMLMLVVLIIFSPTKYFWGKVLGTVYVVSVIVYFVIFGTPKAVEKMRFGDINVISFITWCIVIPILISILILVAVTRVGVVIIIEDVDFWFLAVGIVLSSFLWFLTKLYRRKDCVARLDFYSSIWIFVVTVLTLFDLENKKPAFVFLLSMYFVLQCLIKHRGCVLQEKNT